jgi:aspartate racemase
MNPKKLEPGADGIYNRLMDRMIGILGGMGPEATLDLYRHIIQLTPASRDQDHIRVLIYSNPKIPDRTLAISGKGESPQKALIDSARRLEAGGAGIIAMPCNASHYYLPEIQQAIGIPILNMVVEVCRKLRSNLPDIKAVGLIATNGTVYSRVYHKVLAAEGISVLTPNEKDQAETQAAIAQVKAGIHSEAAREQFHSIGANLVQAGAEAVILGCTEIPLVFDPGAVRYPSLNSTLILAEAAVNWALGKTE